MKSETADAVLEARHLRHSYGARRVLDDLSLRVGAGEIYALLGGNGAGKSTTLNIFLGFVRPGSGSASVCGIDPSTAPDEARAALAYVPESVALYDHLSAYENIDYFLHLAGANRHRTSVIDPALDDVGLVASARGQRVGGFSKGMRQKVAIALALARNVPVLLLDEPTSGLDPRATAEFNDLLEAARKRGIATLMATHDLLSAAAVADRIGFLREGHLDEEVAANGGARFDVDALFRRYSERRESRTA
ncbi:ABC transporter ATP-binding protein [Altericroceibacterium xinjiangense]|uniref:ABC transporter ATP-binding protein n=1 Tax=Altericroceibacterium xinjiangense TaxID=762261 RepID=UPI000F7E060C|nr:ABC transporter ATP-binding protein [Altericroceibacterium xinjiangense]